MIMSFDPRTIGTPVYKTLSELRSHYEEREQDKSKQKAIFQEVWGQAVEIYTYLSTWGLMRLKAEESALEKQPVKQKVVKAFFQCIQKFEAVEGKDFSATNPQGLDALKSLETDDYLGLTGLALALAQEFSFWASAVYPSSDRKDS
jgi:hypothetical protein